MDRAEFRQRAMIAAMRGLIANSKSWPDLLDMEGYIVPMAVKFADALLEANTVEEEPTEKELGR